MHIVKIVDVRDADRTKYDEIIALQSVKSVPNLKTAIFEFVQTIQNQRTGKIAEIYVDDKLVSASLFYTKNALTENSTTSLYSIFSIQPGFGKVAFNEYWKYAHENSRWFKFYVNKHAHDFYNKLGFKYWGVSKTGDNFFTFGKITDLDVLKSNADWFKEPFQLELCDQNYFEKNKK